jgi:hypothetical protein
VFLPIWFPQREIPSCANRTALQYQREYRANGEQYKDDYRRRCQHKSFLSELRHTHNSIQSPAPTASMVSQSKQKACDGYLDRSVGNHYDPRVPPNDLEEFGHKIRSIVHVVLSMTAYPVVGEYDEKGETHRAQELEKVSQHPGAQSESDLPLRPLSSSHRYRVSSAS